MYRHLLRSIMICGLIAAVLYADPFWASKPYKEWTAKEVEKILGDSPWMRSAEVSFDPSRTQGRMRMGGPGGGMGRPGGEMGGPPGEGIGGPPRMGGSPGAMAPPEVYVMWQSAVPIRKAMARAATLKGSTEVANLERQVSEDPEHHVLAVTGLPGGPDGMRIVRDSGGPGGPGSPPQRPGGQPPSPEALQEMSQHMRVEMLKNTFLDVDGTKVLPEKMETVMSGRERVMLFYFPKTVELNSKSKSVTFEISTGPLKILARFKPKDMLF